MAALLTLLVSNVVFAVGLAVIAFLLTRVWCNPHVAHALWLLVLIKLVTPPITWLSLPAFVVSPQDEPSGRLATIAVGTPLPEQQLPSTDEPPAAIGNAVDSRRAVSSPPTGALGLRFWLLGGWAMGLLVFLGVAVRRHDRLMHLIANSEAPGVALFEEAEQLAQQMGLAACPRVLVTQVRVCPLVAPGLKESVVLLPKPLLSELSRDQITTVLAHELAHVRRRDHWTRIFEVTVLAMHWWNPVAWWASRRLRQAEEECCDAWVVWALPNCRRTYGRTLLQTVEYLTEDRMPSPVVGTTFNTGQLEQRINMVMNKMVNRTMTRPVLALVLAIGAIALPLGVAQEPPGEPAAVEREGHHDRDDVVEGAKSEQVDASELARPGAKQTAGGSPTEDSDKSEQAGPIHFLSPKDEQSVVLGVKMLRMELEPLTEWDRKRVTSLGLQGGLRVTDILEGHLVSQDCDDIKVGDILVGLGSWPVTDLASLRTILSRNDIATFAPIKWYGIGSRAGHEESSEAPEDAAVGPHRDRIIKGRMKVLIVDPQHETVD